MRYVAAKTATIHAENNAPVDMSDLDLFAAMLGIAHTDVNCEHNFGREYEVQVGKKFARIVAHETRNGMRNLHSGSAYAFVELATGLIYRPDGWKRPAKHARASFHSEDRGMSACGRYGVAYMR